MDLKLTGRCELHGCANKIVSNGRCKKHNEGSRIQPSVPLRLTYAGGAFSGPRRRPLSDRSWPSWMDPEGGDGPDDPNLLEEYSSFM